jgi:outer membrane protein OmpA-like peptidoglycan-associated protein
MISYCHLRPAVAAALIGAAMFSSIAAAETCRPMIDEFNQIVEDGRENDAQALVDQIATSAECGRYQVAAQRRLAALRLNSAHSLMARGRPVGDYERLLVAADAPEVLWQAAATLAEVRFGERRFAEAAQAYDRGIEIIKNETLTQAIPTKYDIDEMVQRAGQARLLAASGAGPGGGEKFISTAKDHRDGTLGGFYSRSVRGITPQAIAIPITFEFGTTAFTDVGQQAAHELIEVLKEQQPSHLSLVGHTDVRGTAEFNLKLSRERAEAVASFLQQNGINVRIETDGRGANEPMRLSDSSGLSQEDIYALNRRVEWHRE